jgi:biopolymer transport protein ExbB
MSSIPSSVVVDGTLWVLAGFSLATWTLIVIKAVQNFQSSRRNRAYRVEFNETTSYANALRVNESPSSALGRITQVAANALRKVTDHLALPDQVWERQDFLERSLQQQIQRERAYLEKGLAVLASVGSTAPFVGLFGTVWGIMHAMTGIAASGSASIDVVAGPIGEALIATGIGIAVAIPAVLGYNYFNRRAKAVGADFEDFATDLFKIAQLNEFLLGAAHLSAVSIKEKKGLA